MARYYFSFIFYFTIYRSVRRHRLRPLPKKQMRQSSSRQTRSRWPPVAIVLDDLTENQRTVQVFCGLCAYVHCIFGTKSDPSNYRGICISSCIGKLFCSILNQRLLKHVDLHNINYKSQIGFLANNRTAADHVLTLRTLTVRNISKFEDRAKRSRNTFQPMRRRACVY